MGKLVSGPVYPSAEELDRAKAHILEAFGVTQAEVDALGNNGYEAARKAAQAEFEFFRDVVIPRRMEQFSVEIRLGEVPCPDGCTFGGRHWHERRRSGYTTLSRDYVPKIEEVIHGV